VKDALDGAPGLGAGDGGGAGGAPGAAAGGWGSRVSAWDDVEGVVFGLMPAPAETSAAAAGGGGGGGGRGVRSDDQRGVEMLAAPRTLVTGAQQ